MKGFKRLLSWAQRNERKLGAALFAFGFLTDFLTFGLLPVGIVVWIFAAYLALAAVCALGAHAFAIVPENAQWWRRTLHIVFPLGVQYAFGGLLSGFVVFYTAHSVVAASWPFLLFLALVYIGNEYFRMYKHYLVFQTTLLFLTLYAFSVFALPLVIGRMGPLTFLGSTALAAGVFALFLYLLRLMNEKRFRESARQIAGSSAGIVAVIVLSYFGGLIPPVPLALADSGIYHSLVKVPGGYSVSGEAGQAWWDIRTPVVRTPPGELLFAYSAVAAPISFSSTVVHRWEREIGGKWVTESRISFPIAGGREGGYRGYSAKEGLTPGKWRVSVETPEGGVIGRMRFDVESVDALPALIEKTL